MCFYIGIDVKRPLVSGFDHPMCPAIKPAQESSGKSIEMMNWGLIPPYIRSQQELQFFRKGGTDPKTGKKYFPVNTLNAVGEEVFDKPTYKEAVRNRRCLIICSGFYEWRHFTPHGGKDTAYPYYITLKERDTFFMAGIYNPWTDQETGETFDSFAILTTRANALMSCIHNKKKRMPVILPEAEAAQWIDHHQTLPVIASLARYQLPAEQMQAYTIRKDFRQIEEPTEAFAYSELPPL